MNVRPHLYLGFFTVDDIKDDVGATRGCRAFYPRPAKAARKDRLPPNTVNLPII